MTDNNSPWKSPNSLVWIYVGGFALIIFVGILLIQIGFPENYLSQLALLFLVATYFFVGFLGRTMKFSTYLFSNHEVPTASNGQALASGMISSGIFVFLAGQIYNHGGDALAFYSGWILGVALMVILFAAGVYRSSNTTVPGILQPQKNAKSFRIFTMLITVMVCSMLALVQLQMVGLLSETFFSISRIQGISIMSISLAFCLISGGARSLTLARMIVYPIILLCFMVPLIMTAYKFTGNPFPQFAFGVGALEPIAQIESEIVELGFTTQEQVSGLTTHNGMEWIEYLAIMICLACGLAASPHLLQHFKYATHAFEARRSGIWGFAYLLLFLSAIPAFAAFYRFDIYTNLLGLQLEDLETKADWVYAFSGSGRLQVISICGEFISSLEEAMQACNAEHDYLLTTQDIGITTSMMVISSSLLHELPVLVSTILLTGAMLAIWSTLDGLLLAGSTSLSEDGYVLIFSPKASRNRRLFLARVSMMITLCALCFISLRFNPDAELLFELTFAITAATLFPALVIRIWQREASARSIFLTMMVGFVITISLIAVDFLGYSGTHIMIAGLAGLIIAANFHALLCYYEFHAKKGSHTQHEKNDVPA